MDALECVSLIALVSANFCMPTRIWFRKYAETSTHMHHCVKKFEYVLWPLHLGTLENKPVIP